MVLIYSSLLTLSRRGFFRTAQRRWPEGATKDFSVVAFLFTLSQAFASSICSVCLWVYQFLLIRNIWCSLLSSLFDSGFSQSLLNLYFKVLSVMFFFYMGQRVILLAMNLYLHARLVISLSRNPSPTIITRQRQSQLS